MTAEPNWEERFTRHLNILHDHLSLWEEVEKQISKDSDRYQTTAQCMDQTKDMIQKFQEATISLGVKLANNSHKRQDMDYLTTIATTNGYTAPVTDESGLFTIDTNPTPFQTSNSETNKKNKRKHSAGQEGLDVLGLDVSETTIKKKRKSYGQDSGSDRRDSFEQRVEQRLAEKEEQDKQKSNKKRKRESDGAGARKEHPPAKKMHPSKVKRQRQEAQLAEARKKNPNLDMKDIRKINLKENQRQFKQRGITDDAEAFEAVQAWAPKKTNPRNKQKQKSKELGKGKRDPKKVRKGVKPQKKKTNRKRS